MRVLRVLARAWAALSVAFVVFLFLTEWLGSGSPALPTGREWLFFALFPLGVCLGLLLAFARPRLGAAVALLSLLAFYLAEWQLNARTPGPWFALVAAPALPLLFVARQRSGSGSGSGSSLSAASPP